MTNTTMKMTPMPSSLYAAGINLHYFLVVNLCIALVTCIGNSIILAAFGKNPKLRQRNKTMTALVMNLAISDLFHGAVAIPLFAIPHYACVDLKNDSSVVCVLSFLVFHYSMAVSLLTTLAIAVERYIAIAHPFLQPPKMCKTSCIKIAAFVSIWLYPAVGLTALTASNVVGKTWDWCEMSVVLSPYHTAVLGGHLFVILIVATSLYIKIIATVRNSRRHIHRISRTSTDRHRTSISQNCNSRIQNRRNNKHDQAVSSQDVRVVKTLALLMGMFYLCFMPTVVKAVLRVAMGLPKPEPLWMNIFDQIIMIFLMLSPCLDPIIYSWRNKQLREAIHSMLCRCGQKDGTLQETSTRSTSNTMSLNGHGGQDTNSTSCDLQDSVSETIL